MEEPQRQQRLYPSRQQTGHTQRYEGISHGRPSLNAPGSVGGDWARATPIVAIRQSRPNQQNKNMSTLYQNW